MKKNNLKIIEKINLNEIIEIVDNLIFPKRCGFCNKIINKEYTCQKCKKNLEYICINEIVLGEKTDFYTYCFSAYSYTGIVRNKILQFKFNNKKYLYGALSEHLLNMLKPLENEIDIIIAVPISWKRYLERGYNQANLIANQIAKGLRKKCLKNVLIKTKDNKKQSKLKFRQRAENVIGVYKILHSEKIKDKNVLLIDDILTTGATIRECSKILIENGVKKVIAAVVAKTERRN